MCRADIRRRIVSVVSNGAMTPGQLQDTLFDLEGRDVVRELHTLMRLGAVQHNGKCGRGSQYWRRAA
jgi:predicted HTH transcriptional regulator